MTVLCLLDTNVLIYAAAGRETEEPKRLKALELIAAGDFGLSTQVLQEFYVTYRWLTGSNYRPDIALRWIDQLSSFPLVSLDLAVFQSAISISERYKISYWDAAILAAAEALGASRVYSEDLSHGKVYGSVTVINPFADA